MKFLAITHKGISDISLMEIEEILGAKGEAFDNHVTFETDSLIDACSFTYRAQSVRHVLLLLDSCRFKNLEDIRKLKIDCAASLQEGCSFAARAVHDEDYPFSMSDAEAIIGEKIVKKNGLKVDLENPEATVVVFLSGNIAYVGIDLAGFDLSKRSHFLFNHSTAIRGTIAYSLIRMSGYRPKDTLVDPFSIAGYIPIEAAIFASGRSPHHFIKDKFSFEKIAGLDEEKVQKMFSIADKKEKPISGKIYGYDEQLRRIKSAQKNAKLAGLKDISFGRGEIEWLDTKFDEKEIDYIVTYPPQFSKRSSEKDVLKKITELFYQAEYVLSDKGKIILICTNKDKYVEAGVKYGFRICLEREIFQGKEKLNLILFSKGNQKSKKIA